MPSRTLWELVSPRPGAHQPCPSALPPSALFLQQCHFLRQAGHSEKAVSLFQAMVDFTFFKPDSVKGLPTKGQVRVLLSPQLLSPPLLLLGRGVGNRSWW